MQTTLKWMRLKDDDRNPIVEVKDNEYCGECRKHITIRLGSEVIEIQTTEDGLKQIAKAIAEHPEEMKLKAQAKYREAIAEAKRLGLDLVDRSLTREPVEAAENRE